MLVELLLTVADLSYIWMIVSNVLASIGVYPNNVGEVSEKYSILLTPSSFTFLIWTPIFLLTGLYLFYLNYQIYWKEKYQCPQITHFLFFLILSMVANGSWALVWCYDYGLFFCCLLLWLIAFSNMSLYFLVSNRDLYLSESDRQNHPVSLANNQCNPNQYCSCCTPIEPRDLFLTRTNFGTLGAFSNWVGACFLHYAWITLYMTWTIIAALLNTIVYLKYDHVWGGLLDSKCDLGSSCTLVTETEYHLSIVVVFLLFLFLTSLVCATGNWGISLVYSWTLVGLLAKLTNLEENQKYLESFTAIILLINLFLGCAIPTVYGLVHQTVVGCIVGCRPERIYGRAGTHRV